MKSLKKLLIYPAIISVLSIFSIERYLGVSSANAQFGGLFPKGSLPPGSGLVGVAALSHAISEDEADVLAKYSCIYGHKIHNFSRYQENDEPLLYWRTDINNDGRKDSIIENGNGNSYSIYLQQKNKTYKGLDEIME